LIVEPQKLSPLGVVEMSVNVKWNVGRDESDEEFRAELDFVCKELTRQIAREVCGGEEDVE